MPKLRLLRKWPKQKTDFSFQRIGSTSLVLKPQRTTNQSDLLITLVLYHYLIGLLLGNHALTYLLLLSIVILTVVLLVTQITTTISNSNVLEELRLYLAILLGLALALESRETRKEILREYLRETLIYITREVRRSLRLQITQTNTLSHYSIPIVSKREINILRSSLFLLTRLETIYSIARILLLPYISN